MMQSIAQPEQMQHDGDPLGEPKCYILRLPTELFQIVIDFLSEDEIASTENNLLSLCLSSKALLTQAKKRLYKFNADWVSAKKTPHRRWACLDWAIHMGRKETAESVMDFTPEVCELHHLSTVIRQKDFEIAWILLKQETFHTKLKTRTQDNPIFAAVEVGHTELVDDIIKIQKGLDVSMFDLNHKTVLHYACKHGHLDLVDRFLGENADPYVTAKSKLAITPLMSAIECDLSTARYAIIQKILASRPSFQHSEQQYEEYMKGIASKCNLDDLELFMGGGFFQTFLNGPPPDIQRERWQYWIEQATHFKNTEIFRRVLELCPPEHHTDRLFEKVFHMMTLRRDIGVGEVKILIDHFKPTAITDFWPKTLESLRIAMCRAIEKDEFNFMESLLYFYGLVVKSQGPEDSLKSASKRRLIQSDIHVPHSSRMLQLLLCHAFDANHIGYGLHGNTTLQKAIEQVQCYDAGIEAIKDLIPMIDNINAVNSMGRTALHLCVNMCAPQPKAILDKVMEITIMLIDYGADLLAHDNNGNTPLHFAASSRLLDPFVQLFLSRGACMDAINHADETPRMYLSS